MRHDMGQGAQVIDAAKAVAAQVLAVLAAQGEVDQRAARRRCRVGRDIKAVITVMQRRTFDHPVGAQIIGREVPAVSVTECDQALGEFALIKGGVTLFADPRQGVGQVRLIERRALPA